MATSIPQVETPDIIHCLLVDLTLGSNVYYLSTAYTPVTYNSNTYTELGSFLSVGEFEENIKTTNGDLQISLSGIPSEADYMTQVLNAPIKGGEVTIYRAFFDDNYAFNASNVYGRYKGIITNYSISEDYAPLDGVLTSGITVSCASINTLLENRLGGQRTNDTDRTKFYPGDQTFYRVADLQNVQFDFGREYTGSSGGGGYGPGGGGGGPGRDFGRNFQFR